MVILPLNNLGLGNLKFFKYFQLLPMHCCVAHVLLYYIEMCDINPVSQMRCLRLGVYVVLAGTNGRYLHVQPVPDLQIGGVSRVRGRFHRGRDGY